MIKDVYFLDFYNNLIDGNKDNCSRIVDSVMSQGTDIREIYTDLYQKSLYKIGSHWEDSRVSIAEEHLATNIIEDLISKHFPNGVPSKNNGKKAVITCVDKEYHKIGAKMAANIFKLNGWETYFLGASTPTREIIAFIKNRKPEVVGLSFNFYMNMLRFLEVIDQIKNAQPEQKIVVGGQGLAEEKDNLLKKYPDIVYCSSIKELDEYLKSS